MEDVEKVQIEIPNSNQQDLSNYRRSILEMLSKIEIEESNAEFNTHLKTIYDLLSRLSANEKLPLQQQAKELHQQHTK